MKDANQWQEELAGETSTESIVAIQVDALLHSMKMAMDCKRSRGDVVSGLAMEIAKLTKARIFTEGNEGNEDTNLKFKI